MSRPYKKLVLVCTHGRSCPQQGSLETCDALREAVTAAGKRDQIRVVKSGCLAQCGHGPMVAIEPDGRWYSSVTRDDVSELMAGPIETGEVLPRLLHEPLDDGKNVIPRDRWTIPPASDRS